MEKESRPAPDAKPVADQSRFDINARADRSNTFVFTREELWAIDDLQKELEREWDIEVNKYDIVRCALHCLMEDHTRRGRDSFAVKRLREKNPR